MNLDQHTTVGELLEQVAALEVDGKRDAIFVQPLIMGDRKYAIACASGEAAETLFRIVVALLRTKGITIDPRSESPPTGSPWAQSAEGG